MARLGRARAFPPKIIRAVLPVSSLAAGVASFLSSGTNGILLTATDATGGTAPYTYQWQRSTTSGSGFSNLSNGGGVSGATTLALTDDSGSLGTLYYYRLVYTDALSATANSNEVSAQVYEGGAIGTGAALSRVRLGM